MLVSGRISPGPNCASSVMAIRNLVWDMDGTLLDSSAVVSDAFIRAVRRLGGPLLSRAAIFEAYSVGVPEAILAHLLERDLEDGDCEVYYEDLATVCVAAYPGVHEALSELRRRDHPIVVVTGASTRAAQLLLRAASINPDVLVGGDQVARPKPAPDGLWAAAKILGRSPEQIAYIGDAPGDMRAARAAGAIAAAAEWGHLYRCDEACDSVVHQPLDALALLAD